MTMRLRAKLDAFKADFEVGKPPYNVSRSVVETMHRATAAPSAVMVREDAHPQSEASSRLCGMIPMLRSASALCSSMET